MRGPLIALAAAVGGALLVPAVPLAEDPPAPPAAVIEAATGPVEAGQPVKLDSSKSTAGSTPIVGHLWDLDGDGSFETDTKAEPIVEAKPEEAGPLTVQVRVVDEGGQNADAKLDLTVTAPKEIAEAPADEAQAPAGEAEDAAPAEPRKLREPKRDPGAALAGDPPPAPPAQPDAPAAGTDTPNAPAAPAPLTAARMRAAPVLVPKATLKSAAAKGANTRVTTAASTGVTIKDFKFAPASISVSVGDTITWSNQDAAPHNARANDGSFKTADLDKGESGSATMTKAGTFAYICTIHPSMKGTVTVAGASSSGSGGDDTGSAAGSDDTADDTGGLPQTGLNLIAVVLLAALMMASGALLNRRLARLH
jgi:plastocyanin